MRLATVFELLKFVVVNLISFLRNNEADSNLHEGFARYNVHLNPKGVPLNPKGVHLNPKGVPLNTKSVHLDPEGFN